MTDLSSRRALAERLEHDATILDIESADSFGFARHEIYERVVRRLREAAALLCEEPAAAPAPVVEGRAPMEFMNESRGDITIEPVGNRVIIRSSSSPRVPERPTWQPIETAPKNGEDVLLAAIDGHPWVECGYWIIGAAEWHPVNTDPFVSPAIFPTHWMPLPAPPSSRPAPQGTCEHVWIRNVYTMGRERVADDWTCQRCGSSRPAGEHETT